MVHHLIIASWESAITLIAQLANALTVFVNICVSEFHEFPAIWELKQLFNKPLGIAENMRRP